MIKKHLALIVGLVVAAIVAGSAPASALTPIAGTSSRPPAAGDLSRLDPLARVTLGAIAQATHGEEFLAALARAQETTSAHFVYADPVHDVSGDGRSDVVTVDAYIEMKVSSDPLSPTFEYETRYVIRALEGRTSKLLWTKRAHLQNGWLDVVEADTGRDGRNGFALLVGDGALGPIEQRRFKIRVLSGKGRPLWSRSYESVAANKFPIVSYVNVPVILGTFDAFEGAATDYLIGVGNVTWAVDGWIADVGAVAVDGGADGAESLHTTREVGVAGDVPAPWPTGDLSGDGLDDYVFVNPHPQVAQGEESLEVGGTLRGRRGHDGSLVWERGGFDFDDAITVWVYAVSDLVGNPRGDLLATAWIDDGARMRKGTEWDLYLVDGASGGPRWKRLGTWPYVPGDIDRDGDDDIIARGVGVSRNWTALDIRLWAYDVYGKTLWKKTYRTSSKGPLTCAAGCSSSLGAGFGSAGDLQSDGVTDTYATTVIEHDPGERTDVRYLVDGRTGRRSLVSGKELFPLGHALDLDGADVARIRWRDGGVHVATSTGSDSPLWDSAISFGMPADPARIQMDAASVRLDADDCPDVIVSVVARGGLYVVALDGGDGSLLWGRTLDGVRADFRVTTGADRNRAC